MGQCTANARRPTVDSRCRGTTIMGIVQVFLYFCLVFFNNFIRNIINPHRMHNIHAAYCVAVWLT